MITHGKNATHIPRIKIGINSIKHKREIKYLGVMVDKNMTWIPHVNYINDKMVKINHKLCCMSKVTWILSSKVLKEI